MSKVKQLREKYGDRIRESLGAGEGSLSPVVDHPAKNKRYEVTKRATGYFNIPLNEILADPQHRQEFNEEELRSLADSLNADGLIAPIVVRWDQRRRKYVIIAGERRYRAAKLCGWKDIDCEVKPDDISAGEIAEIQLAENHARKDLNPIELAKAFSDVIEKNNYTARELAKRVGVNETTVIRYVRLLVLPGDVQKKITTGKIPVGIAREAARLEGEKKQRAFIDKALKDGYSATDAQAAVSGRQRSKKKKRRKPSSSVKSFPTDYGDVTAQVKDVERPTYDHVSSMLEQALEEVRHRIKNGIRF